MHPYPPTSARVTHLEGHVLEEVGDAIVALGLVAGAGVDPETDGGGGRARVLGSHAQAAVQHGDARRRRVG